MEAYISSVQIYNLRETKNSENSLLIGEKGSIEPMTEVTDRKLIETSIISTIGPVGNAGH